MIRLQSVSLSRLFITGPVTLSTPIIVLKEIADAHSILYDETKIIEPRYLAHLINTINTKNINIIKEPYDMKDYKLIARFVNKHHHWIKSSLNQAFKLLLEYNSLEKIKEVHIGFKYGPQTPEHPDSLNACILYGICKTNRINTQSYTTIDEMASNIEMLFSLSDDTIHHSIRSTIHNAMIYGNVDNYQLINILSQIDPERCVHMMNLRQHEVIERDNYIDNILTDNISEEIHINYQDLRSAGTEIRMRNIRIHPRTHVEAVAMAAIYYKMDISKVKNPLVEYQELGRTPFFPVDRELAKRLQETNQHPNSINNPRLDCVFNINLPVNLYEEEDLISMCLEEGYKNDDIRTDGPYTNLQTSYLLPTFIHGKGIDIEITNTETTMLDDILDLEYDNVILYGTRGYPMRAYTYGELTDTFGSFKRFQMPNGINSSYSEININKLYILCHKDQKHNESTETFRERLELADEIDRTRLYLRSNQEQVRQFIERYEHFNSEQKTQVQCFITLLMESAMYMRGWSGEGPYPLLATDTNVEYEEQPNIELRVTQSIQDIDNMLDELNNIDNTGNFGDLVKRLPLIFYHYRSGELLPSTSEEEGITIYQRINIVKGGENGSIQSCIRMSSNRFAASSYYFMRLLSMPLPFNISDMAHIQ